MILQVTIYAQGQHSMSMQEVMCPLFSEAGRKDVMSSVTDF